MLKVHCLLQVILNTLWLDKDLPDAVFTLRLHHQLLPDSISAESGFKEVYTIQSMEQSTFGAIGRLQTSQVGLFGELSLL